MDAEEVKSKNKGQKQRIMPIFTDCVLKSAAKMFHCFRGFKSGNRFEADVLCSILHGFSDDIIIVFPVPAHAFRKKRIQIPVKLKNCIRSQGNEIEILMNCREDITISGDFLFVSIMGNNFFLNQLFQSDI